MIKTRLIYPNAHRLVVNHEPKPYFVHCYGPDECQICRKVRLWKIDLLINRFIAMILNRQKAEKKS